MMDQLFANLQPNLDDLIRQDDFLKLLTNCSNLSIFQSKERQRDKRRRLSKGNQA